jgi:hypothetical protein
MKPLAIDLFCGLDQPEFGLRADASVKKLVAGRTENPDHVPLCVGSQTPCAVSLELWLVCYFEDARFTTGLTGPWHFWPSARKPIECNIFELPLLFVERPTLFVLARRPLSAKFARCLIGAFCRTIALVCTWRSDRKMPATSSTISAFFGSSFMLVAANASSALCASIAAPFLIGFRGLKSCAAQLTGQIVHRKIIA